MSVPGNDRQPSITPDLAFVRPALTPIDAIAMIVGIVIGAGIFETPALVAANLNGEGAVLGIWLAGGAISLIGALCYAELASAYPNAGGTYYYLRRAFGEKIGFLFAWARMTVIQTGSIALLAFVFGDYLARVRSIGPFSPSIYAALAIALLTALNVFGVRQGKQTQNWLTAAKLLGLVLIISIGLFASPATAEVETAPTGGSWGLALLFVLLSYGGWNEAAYISAEIRDRDREIVRSLVWSIGIITLIYGLINVAYLHGLGLAGMARSNAVAAELLEQTLGRPGAVLVSALIALSTFGAINATLFTGARSNYALGRDFRRFRVLGRWEERSGTPIAALLLQGAISLLLVGMGTVTRGGFATMVDYTAPVFWFFFLLSGIALFVLRAREPGIDRPFRVPLYPITPLAFCAVCLYLLYSSLAYTGWGSLVGLLVVGSGIPLLPRGRKRER